MTYDENDIVCRRMHTVVAIEKLVYFGMVGLRILACSDHLTT